MEFANNLQSLIGILCIVLGFFLRFNPVLVVVFAGLITGLTANMPVQNIIEKIGSGFLSTRNLALILLLPLSVVGLLEKYGLRVQSQQWISEIKTATAGRLLITYLFIREITCALGLTSLGGHAQVVRPILAPMAESAARNNNHGTLKQTACYHVKAMSSATDNVGLFFGEDIFVAFGAIIFMHNFIYESSGIIVEPLHIAVWGIPTAICAFFTHAIRLLFLDTQLKNMCSVK